MSEFGLFFNLIESIYKVGRLLNKLIEWVVCNCVYMCLFSIFKVLESLEGK